MLITTNPQFLGVTQSACAVCRQLVPARVEATDGQVHFRTFCPEHGERRAVIYPNVEDYLRVQRYVKPAWVPDRFVGDATRPCPEGCGFCSRHEQHLCMPIVEITSRCDLHCPICLNASGGDDAADLSPAAFAQMLDQLLAAERQVDVLNLSGGEPLLHPQLLALLDEVARRPQIIRVSISTNGLGLLRNPGLLAELKARNVVVSLQFDGVTDRAYRWLRGRPLFAAKRQVLAQLGAAGITTSLTMTAAAGVNDDQFHAVLDCLFTNPHVVSLMIQPLTFTGRAAAFAGQLPRLTIPDVITRLGQAGHPAVHAADFVPLPCSHPLCFSLAFYLLLDDGRPVSLTQLAPAATVLDTLANRVVFGLDSSEHAKLKELIYELWTGPAGSIPNSDSVLATLRGILKELTACSCCGFNPQQAFQLVERRVKSIFIHAFQDAETFDLARVRRCCQAYPQADGRLLPACVRNVLQLPHGGPVHG